MVSNSMPKSVIPNMAMICCVTFAIDVCQCTGDWTMDNFIDMEIAKIREQVGDKKVLLGLSGGVDSSVVGSSLTKSDW